MARLTKKRYAIIGGIAAVALTAGTAFAFFTSTGSGTGTSTTGTDTAWAVTIDSNTAALTPGGPNTTITFHVKNNSSGVQSLASTVASVTSTSAGANCLPVNYTPGTTSIAYGSVAPGVTVTGSFTLQMNDTGVNQDLCKNATINLKVDAS